MIARHKNDGLAGTQVANAKCEHAVQALNAVWAFLLIKMNNYFSVSVGDKSVAFSPQIGSQFAEIVNLTVIGNPNGSVFVAHRHVAAVRKIKNGKATASE